MAEDKLKYIQFQENESTSNQPKKIPFEIDAKNVIVSIRDNDNEENPREIDLQTFYSELENNYTIFKNTISTNVDDQTKIRFEVLPLSPALSEFGEEDLNALKNIKDINVVDISTEVSSDEPKDKYTVTLDSVKNEIKKIQSLLLAPPVVQIENFGDMINTQKIYVYTNDDSNDEHSDKYGHWFYYSKDENEWKDGGIYSASIEAEKVSNEISLVKKSIKNLKDSIDDIESNVEILNNNDINTIKSGAYSNISHQYQFYDSEGDLVFTLQPVVSGTVTDEATSLVNVAKSWAVGPTGSTEQASATNNAKYYADQAGQALNNDANTIKEELRNISNNYINQSKQWAIGPKTSIEEEEEEEYATSINNSKYYSNLSKQWAIGPQTMNNNSESSINPVPTEQNNAKYYAEQAKNSLDGFNQDIKTKCVISFNGNHGDIMPEQGDYNTNLIIRKIDSINFSTLESQLQRIDTTINTIDNKVDKILSQLNLNINAGEGTEDRSLLLAIEALGWRGTDITNG